MRGASILDRGVSNYGDMVEAVATYGLRNSGSILMHPASTTTMRANFMELSR